jgi:hypothetical protein
MSLSFVAHGPSTGGAKRPAFKAKLNAELHRSQNGEIASFVANVPVFGHSAEQNQGTASFGGREFEVPQTVEPAHPLKLS